MSKEPARRGSGTPAVDGRPLLIPHALEVLAVSASREPVIRPRGEFDRRLAHLERKRIWEHTPAAIDLDITILGRAVALADDVDKALVGLEKGSTKWAALARVQLEALKFGHSIVVETFLDRTIAPIQRIDMLAAIAKLPGTNEDDGDPEKRPADELAAWRRKIGDDLTQLCAMRLAGIVEPEIEEEASGE